jgi:hypothetical protein
LSSNEAKRHCPLTAAIVCLQTMRAEAKSSQVLVCIADVRIRFDHVPGQSVLGCVVMPFAARLGGVVLCYIVNQVLVRLWARVIGISPSVSIRLDWSRSRRSTDLSDRELLFLCANVTHSRGESGAPTVGDEGSEAL